MRVTLDFYLFEGKVIQQKAHPGHWVWKTMTPSIADTRCCIVGGGPAGMMLGYLLARSGVPVVILEKHADFLRDFRGHTVHPSTLQIIKEVGLLKNLIGCLSAKSIS